MFSIVSWCFVGALLLCNLGSVVHLRLFAFCDKDRSGTLDWKGFKHLVRDTLAVPQEAVAKLALKRSVLVTSCFWELFQKNRIAVKEPFPTWA